MPDRLVIALAQLAAVPGDVEGHLARLRAARAAAAGADLLLAPELYLSGFAPLDLLRRPAFVEACRAACEALARETADGGPALLVGLPWAEGGALYNAMALLEGGRIEAVRFKTALGPGEAGRFRPGPDPGPLGFRGARLGVVIGEDLERPDCVECLAETGAEVLLSAHGSPYARGRLEWRQDLAVARVVEAGLPLVYLNGLGAVEDAMAEGGSFALNADCRVAAQLAGFDEAVVRTVWTRRGGGWACEAGELAAPEQGEAGEEALLRLALRDFVARSGAEAVWVAPGDAAAALGAALAAEALGPARALSGPAPGAIRLSTLDRTGLYTSEATLDGDFAPFLDLYGGEVRRLAARRGLAEGGAETAEDAILRGLLEEGRRVADLVAAGFEPERVRAIEAGLSAGEGGRGGGGGGVRLRAPARYPLLWRFSDSGAAAQAPDANLAPRGAQGGAERFEE